MYSIVFGFSLILPVLLSSGIIKWRDCGFASSKKYIGRYKFYSGTTNTQPFYSSRAKVGSKEICNKICKLNDECFATSFESLSMNCSFYNTSDFFIVYGDAKEFSVWLPCNMSSGDQPSDGRCIGLWVSYDDRFVRVKNYDFLSNYTLNRVKCREKCLENHLCGFVNHNGNSHCILVPKWPFLNVINENRTGWITHQWTCVDNFTDVLHIHHQHPYQPNEEKCTGYWTITDRRYRLRNYENIGLRFQTQSYRDCLNECNLHPDCLQVYYNVTYSMCLLQQIERNGRKLFSDMIFIAFKWICVKNDSHNPPMNSDEKRYLDMGMNCYRIVNTENLLIGMDECGRYPTISEFVRCSGSHQNNEWVIKDSCFVNQSYWAFPSETISINNSLGQQLWNISKIFTGIETYWLIYLNDGNLLRVSYLECRTFNAAPSTDILKSHEIISKHHYQALSPKGPFLPFTSKPSIFSIYASHHPHHSCMTRIACMDILRSLQIYYFQGAGTTDHYLDIPYNFMFDEDGNIYEGRGWRNQCADTGSYNDRTICIAYIGWFKDKIPGHKFLNSVKKLIQFALDQEHLLSNYSIAIQQDLGQITLVDYNLEIVIKNWYRYRGFIPEDCKNISILIIIFNLLSFFLITILLSKFIYSLFNFKKSCGNCRFLLESKFDFQQVIPVDSNGIDKDCGFEGHSNYNVIIYEKPKWIANRRQTEVVKLIRLWFWNKYLNSTNMLLSGNTFSHYLTCFPNITRDSVVLETSRIINNGVETILSKVVICTSDSNSVTFLKGLIKRGLCICRYFVVEHIDLTEISIVIRSVK